MSTEAPLTRLAEIGRLYRLAWPVMLAHFQWIALNLIDTAMVGRYSTEELSYLGAGRILHWVAMMVGVNLLSGVTVFAARADGAGQRQDCGAFLRQGAVYGTLLGLIACALLLVVSEPLLLSGGMAPDMAAGGASFVHILAIAYPIQLATTAGSFFLEGISRPRPVMVIALTTLPINAALNWIFIYGNLGAPEMGADGAALGTVLAIACGGVATYIYIWTMRDRAELGIGQSWRGAWREGRALRRFGLAPGLASGFEIGGFSVVGVLAGQLGALPAAAFQAVLSLHIFSLTVSTGLASAAAVRVGNAVGARDARAIPARGWLAAGLAAVSVSLLAIAYAVAPVFFLSPLSNDLALLELAATMLLILAPFLLFDGAQMTLLFSLRAAGDQVVAGVLQIASFFCVMAGSAWWLVKHTDLQALGLPLSLGLGALAAFTFMALRFWWVSRDPPALRGVAAHQAL